MVPGGAGEPGAVRHSRVPALVSANSAPGRQSWKLLPVQLATLTAPGLAVPPVLAVPAVLAVLAVRQSPLLVRSCWPDSVHSSLGEPSPHGASQV